MGNKIYTRPNSITGPLILATILQKHGHKVEVYEELYAKFKIEKLKYADVICISTMTSTAPRAYEIADYFKKIGKRVIIGGMHVTFSPQEALNHCDTVVVGEAEKTIVDIIEERIKESIVESPYPENIDEIDFPDYSLLKTPCKEANIMTTRGCHFSCNYCTTSRMFMPYRERSVESVLEELEYYKKLGFEYVNFQDDNFTGNKNRAKILLTKMIEKNLIFKDVFFFGRAEMLLDDELLSLLSRAHLRSVLIGFESLNPASLDYIGKKLKLDPILKEVKKLWKYKIKLLASFVLGLDTDTREDIRKAVDFCRRVNAFTLQPAILTPFPKTPIYEKYEYEKRMITKKWNYFDLMHVTFKPKNLNAYELQKEFYRALRKFYSFGKSFTIMRIYGISSGLRRLGLWFITRFTNIVSYIFDSRFLLMLKQHSVK